MCYWHGPALVIENYATRKRVAAPSFACSILAFFNEWRPVKSFLMTMPPETHGRLRSLLRQLVRHSLLHRSDRRPAGSEFAMDRWQPWNPAAGFFHSATKDVPFIDMDAAVRALGAKTKTSPVPSPLKSYRGARRVQLPTSDGAGEFPDVLLSRRTWRRFGSTSIDLASFGTLLGLTAGIQHWAHAAGEGKVALKTSPSGGARHSIEVYVLARRVKGLPVGIYHYAADRHALELVHAGAGRRQIERYLPHQPWYTTAAAVIFFTSVFQRALWRYEYARAYRAILIEAGHLCQTFCLAATWLGLAPFCTMALADSRIEQDLGLDGISESVVYAAGVGTRPANTEAPKSRAGTPSLLKRAEVQKFPGRIIGSSR